MFKNGYPYENEPYWNRWRIFCGLYLMGCGLFVLFMVVCFLFEISPGIDLSGMRNWQVFLLSLTPIMFLVSCFSLCPYGDD